MKYPSPVGGGGEHVVDAGVHGVVVLGVRGVGEGVVPEHQGQVLAVHDVLDLSDDQPPGLLVQDLIPLSHTLLCENVVHPVIELSRNPEQ